MAETLRQLLTAKYLALSCIQANAHSYSASPLAAEAYHHYDLQAPSQSA
jgi:hypothetical protein